MVGGLALKNCIAWKETDYHSFQSVLQQDQVLWSNLSWEASVSDIPQHSLKSWSHWLSIVCLHLSKNFDVQKCIKYSKRWKKIIISCSHAGAAMCAHTQPYALRVLASVFQWDVFFKDPTKFTLLICILCSLIPCVIVYCWSILLIVDIHHASFLNVALLVCLYWFLTISSIFQKHLEICPLRCC